MKEPEDSISSNDNGSPVQHSRRDLLKALFGLGAGSVLLGMGVVDKLFQFFRGPRLTSDEQVVLIEKRLHRHRDSVVEAEREIDRLRSGYILVAKLIELSPTEGKYFIDYEMRSALAFADEDGLPLLISAKCTHLGCTVGNKVNDQNKILCPCHLSSFDIRTGQPSGGPATVPLPRIGWVLKGPDGNVVASRGPTGPMEGKPDPDKLETYTVWIAKKYEDKAA
jgi:nitrite reductase/ring-hydroxylating ferredoxin subunit